MREVNQRLDNTGYPICLFENTLGGIAHFVGIVFIRQILRKTRDAGNRIANFVGDTRRQATNGSQTLTVQQFAL